MESHLILVILSVAVMISEISLMTHAAVPKTIMKHIGRVNKNGPYLGIVVPNAFEMDPLLQSPSLVVDHDLPYFDFCRWFRFGRIRGKKVIIVMTGLSMLNAGTTTELLLTLFRVKGVIHYGIAGNADPQLEIGDVTIPRYWAHTGLWNWQQRIGDGPDDELALESNGDYTRKIGFLKFSNFSTVDTKTETSVDNLLNNVWYQPEEIFPVDGTPEIRQHVFWIPVDKHYFSLAKKLEGLKLERCLNSTNCLPRAPIAVRVQRSVSANVFVDNKAYREFLQSTFNVTSIDMETAAVALVCLRQKIPFIAIRSLSDLAGGGSALSNEAATFAVLASQNAATALVKFISLL
ncbi:bark storage protein A [Cucumis melo var. makuwa]|uniref:Bark storage protein A n=1 Tax=Cucumis melo var. makuwa TaxID=1194695 RepID=A0A5A7V320_CUCMM|nr:bark storage protein A [Cucumis melo var. makuwa]